MHLVELCVIIIKKSDAKFAIALVCPVSIGGNVPPPNLGVIDGFSKVVVGYEFIEKGLYPYPLSNSSTVDWLNSHDESERIQYVGAYELWGQKWNWYRKSIKTATLIYRQHGFG